MVVLKEEKEFFLFHLFLGLLEQVKIVMTRVQ